MNIFPSMEALKIYMYVTLLQKTSKKWRAEFVSNPIT